MKQDTRQITEDIKEHLKGEELEEALSLITDLHPADQADVLENLAPAQQQELMAQLSPPDSADIMEELEDEHAAQLAIQMGPAALSLILDEMEADEAADVLGDLPAATVAVALEAMTEAEDVISLLRYPDDTAGGLMVPDFIALQPEMTTAEAIEHIRRIGPDEDTIYYLFVTDENGVLLGVVGLRQLIVADSQRRIEQIMDEAVIYVEAWTDQEECARLLSRYDFLALPVVDEGHHLLGVITVDDIIDVIDDEATEDMYRMVGLTEEEKVFSPLFFSVRKRLPWLLVNLLTIFIAVSVVNFFEGAIGKLVALAVFMPVVAGQGGNAGSQTLTIMVRGLALGEIDLHSGRRALLKEAILGVVNGAAVGVVTAVIAYLWKGDPVIGLAIGAAMILNMFMAGLSGVLVPLGLKYFGIDPALASAAFVTAVTDTMGYLFFLGLATLLLQIL